MKIQETQFLGSFKQEAACPQELIPEYAFIGRSNVGKSSLINMLTGRSGLAKVSSTPGKTQSLNLFLINDSWRLADLPGYGYARVSKTTREGWTKMINGYLLNRAMLACIFVLIDSRIPPQQSDLEFINWMGSKGLPLVIVFTKADKINSPLIQSNIKAFKDELLKKWEDLPPVFITSAETGHGKDEILDFIHTTNAA